MAAKVYVPKSILDLHDYMIEVELPSSFAGVKEVCVKESRSGKFEVDFDCTVGHLVPIPPSKSMAKGMKE